MLALRHERSFLKNQVLDPKRALVRPTRGWVCSAKFRAMNLPIGSPTPPRFADLLLADGDSLANIKLSEEPAMRSLTLPRAKRISGPKKFRSSGENDFSTQSANTRHSPIRCT